MRLSCKDEEKTREDELHFSVMFINSGVSGPSWYQFLHVCNFTRDTRACLNRYKIHSLERMHSFISYSNHFTFTSETPKKQYKTWLRMSIAQCWYFFWHSCVKFTWDNTRIIAFYLCFFVFFRWFLQNCEIVVRSSDIVGKNDNKLFIKFVEFIER